MPDEYPKVTNYIVRRKGQRAYIFQHKATIELDESRSFDVSCVSDNAEKDERWILSLYIQDWPEQDTQSLEERVAKLENQLCIIAESINRFAIATTEFTT